MSNDETAGLHIIVNGREAIVSRADYVRLKTLDLREFGYASLTEAMVDEQVTAVLSGKKLGGGLTVIGAFMQDEILRGTRIGA